MAEEHKEEKHEEHKKEGKPRLAFLSHIKLTKKDILAIIALIVFVIAVTIPGYVSKDECEVARPDYKCASLKDVMIENCNYWGKYDCNTNADVSLPQIEWYILNLCKLQNQYHNTGLDCSDLKSACNKITGSQTCPAGYIK